LIVFFFLKKEGLTKIIRSFFKIEFWFLIIGFIAPILLTVIYYFSKGAGYEYFAAAFAQNIPYLSSWSASESQALSLPIPLITRALILGLIILAVFWSRKKNFISPAFKLILVWFFLAVFAALLSSRPYPHYLYQAVPALSLAAGLIFSSPGLLKLTPIIFVLVIRFIFVRFDYFRYPTGSYYQNFSAYLLGKQDRPEYLSFWGDHVENLYEAAAFLKSHTQPEEKVFIWGDQTSLYPLSERLPVGRYAAAYHIKDFDEDYRETLTALSQSPPRFFVVFKNDKTSLNKLLPFLRNNYSLIETFGEIEIFYHHPHLGLSHQ